MLHYLPYPLGSWAADAGVVSGRPVSHRADSEACFTQIRIWMDICREKHQKSCPYKQDSELPTRVIDVDDENGPFSPVSLTMSGLKGEWTCLSHCWGSSSGFITESGNLAQMTKSIPLESLPRTFLDAIQNSKRVGYHYLWIDSLCITQDSHQDWVQESARMGRYYKHATVAIAADVARGDHEGFLTRPRQLRAPSIFIPSKTQSTDTTTNIGGVYIHDSWKCQQFRARDTPLMERAWTLQEDLLSPRTVHYTPEQLLWECQCRKYCESDMNPMDNSIGHVWQNLKPQFPEASSKSPYLSRYG